MDAIYLLSLSDIIHRPNKWEEGTLMRPPRKRLFVAAVAGAVALLVAAFFSEPTGRAAATVQSGACPTSITSAVFVPVVGAPLDDVRFAPDCSHLYASNPAANEIEVLSLDTMTLETAIPVGQGPRGLDITPDGTTLYVANSGEHSISVVDLATKTELRKINVPWDLFLEETPLSIAIANNGKALLSTTFSGSGFTTFLALDLTASLTLPPKSPPRVPATRS
jgi:YVTN family beta-propeller protein